MPIRRERARRAFGQEAAMSVSLAVVIAYKVLEATTRQALEEAVREALSQGWQPLGGLEISNGIFYQAIVGS